MKGQQGKRITTHPRRKARLERALSRKLEELGHTVFKNEVKKEEERVARVSTEIERLKERIFSDR